MITSRLIIDQIKLEDSYDCYINIANDKKVLETFMDNYSDNYDDFKSNFNRYIKYNIFAIRLKENNKLIGMIDYFDVKDDKCEIGYCLGSKYWNYGYMTEAVQAFIQHLFNNGFNKVYAGYFKGNESSKRVMEKCGMKYDHTNEKELVYNGEEKDVIYYLITKSK